jgi:hypothetical protein
MRGTPPTPEELARWLLSSKSQERDTLEEVTMAAVHIYERLRDHFGLFLGPHGFDSLWARTLHLVQRAFPWDDDRGEVALPTPHHRLGSLVQGRNVVEAHEVLLAVFTQFFALLFTFIGADLGFHLLHQHWPALPAPTTDVQGEEAQQ